MSLSFRISLVAAVLLMAFAACKSRQSIETGIVIEVTSDLAVPKEINQIRLTSIDFQGNTLLERTVAIGIGPNRVPLPLREGLYPLHDTDTPIHVKATGLLDDTPVVSSSATLSFVRGKQIVLPLPLLASCAPAKCVGYETCRANGRCQPDTVISADLPTYRPNQPIPGQDAAVPGADGGTMGDTSDADADAEPAGVQGMGTAVLTS
jgi:hypothetical protein